MVITVLQIVQLPNVKARFVTVKILSAVCNRCGIKQIVSVTCCFLTLQVSTVLLSCAFVYDIFWVFMSPTLFNESVMIVVSTYF